MTGEHSPQAYAAIEKAVTLEAHATQRERAYIEALRKRYAAVEPADRTPLDVAFKDAMAALSARYPEDTDAYYLHAVEMSPDPGSGLVAAHRLETLAPSAGHLVHMPAHIYLRTGE